MTTTIDTETLADKIAMAFGGGLLILSVVVLGLIELIAGEPYSPISDGEVAAGVAIDPYWRAVLIVVGMIVLGLFAVYAFTTSRQFEN